jgi:hypothetical protein
MAAEITVLDSLLQRAQREGEAENGKRGELRASWRS